MKRYRYSWLTFLLACALVPPFVVRTLYYNLEAFPAVLLPSGAGTVSVGRGEVKFTRVALWGRRDGDSSNWARIEVERFLHPIPVHYLSGIARNSFGLNPAKAKLPSLAARLNSAREFEAALFLNRALRAKVTATEVQDGKRWLSRKLSRFGYVPTEMRITSDHLTFAIETGKVVAVETLNEEILALD